MLKIINTNRIKASKNPRVFLASNPTLAHGSGGDNEGFVQESGFQAPYLIRRLGGFQTVNV